MQQVTQAIASHKRANEIVDQLVADNPNDVAVHRLTANGIHLAAAHRDTATKEQALREVIRRMSDLARRFPTELLFESSLATARHQLGDLLQSIGRLTEAETEFRQAMETQLRLVEANPETSAYRYQLAASRTLYPGF
jgi:tetratricopeptide (TPR) repeat protein